LPPPGVPESVVCFFCPCVLSCIVVGESC
jgi:hypothetical protein